MTRYDLLDIRAALDKASNWAHSQKDLFQMIDAKKKVEAMLNEPSLPSNLDEAAEEYSLPFRGSRDIWKSDIIDAFKAGAGWMKTKMIKEDAK